MKTERRFTWKFSPVVNTDCQTVAAHLFGKHTALLTRENLLTNIDNLLFCYASHTCDCACPFSTSLSPSNHVNHNWINSTIPHTIQYLYTNILQYFHNLTHSPSALSTMTSTYLFIIVEVELPMDTLTRTTPADPRVLHSDHSIIPHLIRLQVPVVTRVKLRRVLPSPMWMM